MKTSFSIRIAFFFILSFLAVSCHRDTDALNMTFSKVEKCMDLCPDSALNLLKGIHDPEKLWGESQATYALLMTQAMDKNYMKFSSDSLIALALNYYTITQTSPIMYAKALFYHGRVMLELDKEEEALKSFLAVSSNPFPSKSKISLAVSFLSQSSPLSILSSSSCNLQKQPVIWSHHLSHPSFPYSHVLHFSKP